jgi:hypothetical protein
MDAIPAPRSLWALRWRCPRCARVTPAHVHLTAEERERASAAALCRSARYTCPDCGGLWRAEQLAWHWHPENRVALKEMEK